MENGRVYGFADERGVELGNCVDCGIAVAMRPREVEGWYRIPTQRESARLDFELKGRYLAHPRTNNDLFAIRRSLYPASQIPILVQRKARDTQSLDPAVLTIHADALVLP